MGKITPVAGSPCTPYGKLLLRYLEKVYLGCVMENQTPIKPRKPRTVKEAAPHVAAMKKAMSVALKAEHAYASAAGKIEKQIQELRQGLETNRAAAKDAWYQVHLTASDCVRAHEA